jgi:hypothetical protein
MHGKRVAASNVQAVWKRFGCKLSFMQFFHMTCINLSKFNNCLRARTCFKMIDLYFSLFTILSSCFLTALSCRLSAARMTRTVKQTNVVQGSHYQANTSSSKPVLQNFQLMRYATLWWVYSTLSCSVILLNVEHTKSSKEWSECRKTRL